MTTSLLAPFLIACLLVSIVPSCLGWIASGASGYIVSQDVTFGSSVSLQLTSGGQQMDLATLLNALQLSQPPIGSVTAFSGSSSPSSNWLLCDGSPLRDTDYPLLFSVIGTLYGNGVYFPNGTSTGDPTFTFSLPDYRGQFLRGVSGTSGVDPDAGSRTPANPKATAIGNMVGSYQLDDFASHNHEVLDPGHSHNVSDPGHVHSYVEPSMGYDIANINGDNAGANPGDTAIAYTGIGINTAFTNIATLNRGGSESRPKNVAVNWIIRAN